MKKSSKYWQDRFLTIEKSSNAYGIDTYKQIESAFNDAQRQIEKEIDIWIARIAKNNEISITEARKLLNTRELAEFKWDIEEYIKYGKENAVSKVWIKQLENASAKFHIARLEALKIKTQQELERAFGNELDSIDRMILDVYSDNYYKSIYEIQKGFNTGFNVAKIDKRKLDLLKVKPWAADGKNFSDRIWQSKSLMVNELHNEMVKICILGKSPDEAIKHMSRFVDKKFKNPKLQAKRLVMTELAYFSSMAQKQGYEDLGVEQYEIVATLDNLTSEICQNMDGKVFDTKDHQVGVTAQPFHVECRTTTVPFFDDEFDFGGERAARDEDGKTYYVPDNMTYPEWKEKYVEDAVPDVTKKEFENYKGILGMILPSLAEFMKIKYNDKDWKLFKAYTSSIASGELTALADFDLYKKTSEEIDEVLVGVVSSNNIAIAGKSNHFIARVIGSVEQKRNGVPISDILEALTNPDEIKPIRYAKNGASQKFVLNEKCVVSINPETGMIIQVNPYKR